MITPIEMEKLIRYAADPSFDYYSIETRLLRDLISTYLALHPEARPQIMQIDSRSSGNQEKKGD